MPLLQTKPNSKSHYSAAAPVSQDQRERKWSKNVSRSRSKNVGRVRRSGAKDARILQRVSAFQPATDGVSSSVGHPTPLHSSSQTPLQALPTPSPIPVWALTGDRVKAVFATGALLIADRPAVAFTFNLTEEAIEKAKGHPAGFLDSLKRSLDAELKKAFGSVFLYWFVIDISDGGRLHIHGAFLPPAISTRTDRKIREAMTNAWGKWSGPGNHKQVQFKPLYSDDWATYAMANQRKVAKLIRGRTFTINQPLRREAAWTYDEVRRIMRDGPDAV